MGLLRTSVLLALAAASVTAIPNRHHLAPRQSVASPCATVSASSSLYLAANPTATTAIVPGPLAYQCLQSIPIDQNRAVELVDSLIPFFEFQADLAYLRSPPSAYLYPKVDILQGLDQIKSAVKAGEYSGEYDFQSDLQALVIAARDGHFSYAADLTGLFAFKVPNTPLASYSSDGIELPQIWATSDLLALTPTGGIGFRNTSIGVPYTPSPIVQIDGVDVVTYLEARSEEFALTDPDAAWNYLFSATGQIAQNGVFGDGGFPNPAFYPGDTTYLTFENGSTNPISTGAEIYGDFSGVTDGVSAYNKFCNNQKISSPPPPPPQQPSPVVPFFPFPVVKDSDNSISGYFLNDTGFTDTAVVAILNFDRSLSNGKEFQNVTQQFLAACQSAGKSKLVIDLQSNGGGTLELAFDFFTQLFPTIYPHSQGNMRNQPSLNAIGEAYSAIATTTGPIDLPFDYEDNLKPDGSSFASWAGFYNGSNSYHGDSFTQVFEENLSFKNITAIPISTGSGTAPFTADNIVILTDGFCASTCAVFVELMKNLAGVKSVVIGGRPQTGPMQAVGGTKGSLELPIQEIYDLAVNATSALPTAALSQFNQTEFANISTLPLLRAFEPWTSAVNGRNNIRRGDTSVTPLQFVYEAADCRFWFTHDMLINNIPIWERAAGIAFGVNGTAPFTSDYCVSGSTGHPSSLSGGSANATNAGVGIAPPATANNGTNIPMGIATNGTIGNTAGQGKEWGNLTSSASSTASPTATSAVPGRPSVKNGAAQLPFPAAVPVVVVAVAGAAVLL